MIILKFSQHHWIVNIGNNCFLWLFLKLFAAHSLMQTYFMRWFRFSTYKLFASFIFSTKSWSLLNSPKINKNLLFEVIVVFCYIFRFSHMFIVCWELTPWKKGFTSVSLLLFTKNQVDLVMTSPWFIMTSYWYCFCLDFKLYRPKITQA